MRYVLGALVALFLCSPPAWADEHSYRETQIFCLARNIYEEARSEPIRAQIMVGLITQARTRDSQWPSHVCRVVYQHGQFSWTLDKLHEKQKDYAALTIAHMIARGIYDGEYIMPLEMSCARWC